MFAADRRGRDCGARRRWLSPERNVTTAYFPFTSLADRRTPLLRERQTETVASAERPGALFPRGEGQSEVALGSGRSRANAIAFPTSE